MTGQGVGKAYTAGTHLHKGCVLSFCSSPSLHINENQDESSYPRVEFLVLCVWAAWL